MKIKGLHHAAISVKNLEKSIQFYSDTFGFEEIQRFERTDLHGKAVFLQLGDTFIEIWQIENVVGSHESNKGLNVTGIRHIALAVDDLPSIYNKLKSSTNISEPIKGASGKMISFLTDPDGISIELYEVGIGT